MTVIAFLRYECDTLVRHLGGSPNHSGRTTTCSLDAKNAPHGLHRGIGQLYEDGPLGSERPPRHLTLLPRAMRLVRLPEVQQRVGLGRSTIYIYRRMDEGAFPKPKPLGGGLVAWLESDIDDWIDERIAHRAQELHNGIASNSVIGCGFVDIVGVARSILATPNISPIVCNDLSAWPVGNASSGLGEIGA